MAQSSQNPRWSSPVAAMIILAALIIARSPSLFTDPRFWAEEGTHFYARFLSESTFSALLHAHAGSYQLLANAMVVIATKVPLWAAPAVTTYLSFGVLLVVAYQLGLFVREYQVGRVAGLLLLLAFTLQWGMYEIALTATNVQWVAGLSALLVLALPSTWLDRNLKAAGLWLLVCGLSGVPAAICAPAFALKAFVSRSRSTAIAAGVLFLCAAVQAACVLHLGTPGREYGKTWAVLIMPTLLQTGIEPFTGPEPVFLVGTYINGALPKIRMLLIAAAILGGGIIAFVAVLARAAVKDRIVPILLAAWLFVCLAQTVGALHSSVLLSAAGARYYVFGVTALLLMLALATTGMDWATRSVAVGALALICVAGLGQRLLGDWTPSLITGPSWKRQLQACKTGEQCVVRTWPNDGTVYLIIDGGRVRSSYYPVRLPDLAPAAF